MHSDLLVAVVLMGGLIVINTVGVAMVLMQMPGTWLILFATATVAFVRWDQQSIGLFTLAMLLALAIVGELIETAATASSARKAGASWPAAIAAMVGAVFGAIVGTILIPMPVAGTLAGACAGAGLGALGITRINGHSWEHSRDIGYAAAKGRLWGTAVKVAVACAMWLVALIAIIVP